MQTSVDHGDADRRRRKCIDIHADAAPAYVRVVNGQPIICGTGGKAVDGVLPILVMVCEKPYDIGYWTALAIVKARASETRIASYRS